MYYAKFIAKETGDNFEMSSLDDPHTGDPRDAKRALDIMGISNLRDQCYNYLQTLPIPKNQIVVIEIRKHATSEISSDKLWAEFVTTKAKARRGKPKKPTKPA